MADVVYRIEVAFSGDGGVLSDMSKYGETQDSGSSKPTSTKLPSVTPKNIINAVKGDVSRTELLANAGLQVAKKGLDLYVSTIGIRTGNSYIQQETQFGLDIVSTLVSGTVAGFTTTGGNPIGAIIGFVLSAGGLLVNAGLSNYSAGIKKDWNTITADERQRVMSYASSGFNRTGGALY